MQSAFIQTRDLRVHYLQAGRGRPLLLVHGFPETSYEWRHQIEALSEDFSVFAPDNRGFGQTDKPDIRISRQMLGQDLVNFMDALGIGRADVAGHDWGGFIAFKLAIDWPERVSRLALLDTFCTTWGPTAVHGYWFKTKPLPEEFFARYHRQFIETLLTGASDPALPGRPDSPWRLGAGGRAPWATAGDLAHYTAAFADPASHRAAISYYRYALPFHRVVLDPVATHGERYQALDEAEVAAMWLHPEGLEQHPDFNECFDFGPEDRHKRYEGPTLWLRGSAFGGRLSDPDPRAVPHGHPILDQFSRYFPNLQTLRMDAGHFFPEEVPEQTTAALRQFFG